MQNKLLNKTAIIIIDLQNDYVHEEGQINKWKLGTKNLQEKLPKINNFIEQARQKNLQIVHIQMTEGRNSIDPTLKEERVAKFGNPEEWELAIPGTWGYELMLEIKKGEKVFKKNNLDMFTNKELEEYLRKKGIENLFILGGYTHACVNASVRSAKKRGFNVTLVTDLVGSPDKFQELHLQCVKELTQNFAQGINSEEIFEILEEEKDEYT